MTEQIIAKPVSKDFTTRMIVVVIVALFIVQLVVTLRISTMGKTLGEIEKKWATLRTENQQLEEKVANYTALSVISERAVTLGLIRPTNILYLTPHTSQALYSSASMGQQEFGSVP